MKKFILAFLLCAAPVFAQSTPQALNHFSITGSGAGFTGAAGGSQATSITGISYQFTSHVSFGYQNILVPSVSSYDFGVFEYATPLSSIIGKKLSSSTTFDASSVTVSFLGGAGEVMSPAKHIAETAGVYVSFPMKTTTGGVSIGPVLGFQYVHSPSVNGFVTSPSSAAISAGLGISF